MPSLSIESNGRLENTAIYINGMQIGGVKEILLSLDEDGTLDAVIQYLGTDNEIYTKQIFRDSLNNLKTVPPSYTDAEAESLQLQLLTIESEGDIETTDVLINDEYEEGIVNVFIHIKSAQNKKGISSVFGKKEQLETETFKAQITYRNEDETLETEEIF